MFHDYDVSAFRTTRRHTGEPRVKKVAVVLGPEGALREATAVALRLLDWHVVQVGDAARAGLFLSKLVPTMVVIDDAIGTDCVRHFMSALRSCDRYTVLPVLILGDCAATDGRVRTLPKPFTVSAFELDVAMLLGERRGNSAPTIPPPSGPCIPPVEPDDDHGCHRR